MEQMGNGGYAYHPRAVGEISKEDYWLAVNEVQDDNE